MYRLHRAMLAYQDARGQADSVITALSPAAWYRNATDVVSSGGFASIWADYASSDKGLVLPGLAGNYASTPDAAWFPTGDIDMRLLVNLADWTPATSMMLFAKDTGSPPNRTLLFYIAVGGTLTLITSADGTTLRTGTATATTGITDGATYWVRATRSASSGDVNFYKAADSSGTPGAWVQIGATRSTTAEGLQDAAQVLEIGTNITGSANPFSGSIYRASIYSTIDGTTPVFDADFSSQAIGAGSFTESSSNAATVTINASGAAPAHIGKARDLLQGTGTNQPAYAAGVFTFDGADNYMRATFTLDQGLTIVHVMKMLTWTSADRISDGNSANSTVLIEDGMGGGTPAFNMFAGSHACQTTDLSVGDFGIVMAVFNGASSLIRVNDNTEITGNVGANNSGGIVLGAGGGAGQPSNTAFQEVIAFPSALALSDRNAVITALNNVFSVF